MLPTTAVTATAAPKIAFLILVFNMVRTLSGNCGQNALKLSVPWVKKSP
jgi:hypothetical protein